MTKPFGGVIDLDVRDSRPDWSPFVAESAPSGAPNVLIVLYDDTGLAAWSPYGGRINMPTLDRLAAGGLTYSQWHTVALCAPTRSCLLTGRNHHQNGCANISEVASGFPGYNSHIPFENAFLAEVLRQRGWNTFWIGKNHNIPIDEWAMGGSKRNWPLQRGFDRFYGFLGGETNQWYPDLTEDNHFIDQPYLPEDGYHLSKDLADKAISFIRDSKQSDPAKPWFTFFCPGANHAPHHAPTEWIDKYKGAFDDGYEAYREWVLPRMVERGILPDGTELTAFNPMPQDTFSPGDAVLPWDSLSADEKRLFSRMAEVYAGYSEYTDHQVGRIVDYLEKSGQLDNTIVMYCADNGASGEGSPTGSVNENKFFNGFPDDVEENLTMLDKLGSPDTYNHYPTGWAAAFSTPFRMFKRYSYLGGVSDPLVIHWPAGIKAAGEVRDQYHHVIDIVPTILDCCGIDMPSAVNGHQQTPLPGTSMRYTFEDAAATTARHVQYYEMMGTRAIWKDGWRAVTVHGPQPIDKGHFDEDVWQLFHIDVDRSEAHDLAEQEPERLAEMIALWNREAEKYGVLPLSDLGVAGDLALEFKVPVPPSGVYTYYADTLEVPERSAANTHGVSYRILAEVELTDAAEGVIMAHGSRFGGHALFISDHRLHYVYNFLGIPPEQHLAGEAALSAGKHVLGVDFAKQSVGEHGESHGVATLYVDDEAVATAEIRTQTGHFTLCGEGMCIGVDSGDNVSKQYGYRFPFTGGAIEQVEFHVGDDAYVDVERHLEAAFAPGLSRLKLKLLVATMGRAWARAVITIVCSAVLLGALGLSEVSGYATIPGIYMALSPPAGRRSRRVLTIVVATLVIAAISVIAAELTRWTAAVAISLALAGFAAGLLPRLGSLAAAMQLPVLMSFAYSIGQPLSDAAALTRGLAVLLALPIYVVAAALAFQVDQRRPLVLGAARALGELAAGLGHGARADEEAELAEFRSAMARLRDSALPVGGSRGDHAALALAGAVQQAFVAAELLLDTHADAPARRTAWLGALAQAAGATARTLAGHAASPPTPAAEVAVQARHADDHATWLLADALADAASAAGVLMGTAGAVLPDSALGRLPSPARRLRGTLDVADPAFRRAVRLGLAAGLAGLAASLLELGRAYWPVFSVIVIFNAPAARDWRRALQRIGGTILGVFLALPLIELAGTSHALATGIGLVLLLPGLILMPINYGAAMIFITATVGMLFSAGGTVGDFLSYRIEDTLLGAAIAAGIGLLLWHTKSSDWWRAARRMAGALAEAVGAADPRRDRDTLVIKAMALRSETVEASAATPAFGAAWLYMASAEDLIRTLTGPSAEPVADGPALAARLRDIEAGGDVTAPPPASSAADEEVTEMAAALTALRAQT